jgi:hypothetical protein
LIAVKPLEKRTVPTLVIWCLFFLYFYMQFEGRTHGGIAFF